MTFQELIAGLETLSHRGNPEIAGIQYDSRRVGPGDVFVAMRGEQQDGSRFVAQAVERGALAVVSEGPESVPHPGIAWAQVPHGRRALAVLSANFFGRPAALLKITGITGTNGKTTTAFLLESILAATGRSAALLGTIEYHIGADVLSATHTTPESLELNQLLHRAVRARVSEAVMEVSSHALAQQRVYGFPFDTAVFTNLSRDHLDYHGDFEEYFAAKRALFAGMGSEPPRASVLNVDDQHGARLVPFCLSQGSSVLTFGVERGDFRAQQVEMTQRGVSFLLLTPNGAIPLVSNLPGQVNLYNILAAAAAAAARGCSLEAIQKGGQARACVPGRFEQVQCGQPFGVVVDYAHTD
ncbi:MAG: Mur ligase family protein, partial [Terriglobales bacterium]